MGELRGPRGAKGVEGVGVLFIYRNGVYHDAVTRDVFARLIRERRLSTIFRVSSTTADHRRVNGPPRCNAGGGLCRRRVPLVPRHTERVAHSSCLCCSLLVKVSATGVEGVAEVTNNDSDRRGVFGVLSFTSCKAGRGLATTHSITSP